MLRLKTGHYCWYVCDSITDETGELIPVVVCEGEKGFHLTDYRWGKKLEMARLAATAKNSALGLTPEDVNRIIASSMTSKGAS